MIAPAGGRIRCRIAKGFVVVIATAVPIVGATAVPAAGDAKSDAACSTIRPQGAGAVLRVAQPPALRVAASALRSSDARGAARVGERLLAAVNAASGARLQRALQTAADWCAKDPPAPPTTVPPVASFHVDGTGTGVVDLPLPQGQVAVVHFVAREAAPAQLVATDLKGATLDTLVDVVGPYDGVRPLNFEIGATPARLSIRHAGGWSVDVDALESIPILATGVERTGTGDAVLATNGTATRARLDASLVTGRFRVEGHGILNLVLVDSPTAYEGTVILPAEARWVLEVSASGPWTVTLS